jgi:hypothetical protein
MAIRDEAEYRIRGPVTTKLYRDNVFGNRLVREEAEFTVEWKCDETGGETTHESTFGTDGFELVSYGPDVPYGGVDGMYSETYRKQLSPWTLVDSSSSTP